MSIAEAQMNFYTSPEPPSLAALDKLDLFLIIAFSVELVINAFANWLRDFVCNGWNLFDVVIVALSIVGLAPVGLPVRLVLLLRCCRVLRIFGKLPAVAKIFSALSYSVLPMANAFFIIFVITAICERPAHGSDDERDAISAAAVQWRGCSAIALQQMSRMRLTLPAYLTTDVVLDTAFDHCHCV